ncbi:J domain-containing protein [Phragmitibacter flavus]|uniref:J domain-containing protein n=1 Tax=Phragmitibacter flavus TaxID=2576071 RepID=A0A5R8KHK5_9BACT|nr:J domain-containing protein [Phragmitibacter flavus]TLD71465.1 J domain-containing protein [Phragmitibacter flavus]
MPAILFLRSSFGYSFLSPKTVFLPCAQVSFLFLIVTWVEPWLRKPLWAVALFAASASFLYVAHLLAAFWREKERKGKHDFYAGTSHLLRIPGFSQNRGNQDFETVLHLWIEPAVVFVAAVFFRGFLSEQWLSLWLLVVVAGMWLKAFINYWYGIRSEKKHTDIIEDAEEKMPGGGAFAEVPLPNASGRKPKRTRPPQSAVETADQAIEQRYAELLRLMPPRPPYDLQQAEQNYRELMKAFHPDPNRPTPENHEKSAELNEAIAHFRRTNDS